MPNATPLTTPLTHLGMNERLPHMRIRNLHHTGQVGWSKVHCFHQSTPIDSGDCLVCHIEHGGCLRGGAPSGSHLNRNINDKKCMWGLWTSSICTDRVDSLSMILLLPHANQQVYHYDVCQALVYGNVWMYRAQNWEKYIQLYLPSGDDVWVKSGCNIVSAREVLVTRATYVDRSFELWCINIEVVNHSIHPHFLPGMLLHESRQQLEGLTAEKRTPETKKWSVALSSNKIVQVQWVVAETTIEQIIFRRHWWHLGWCLMFCRPVRFLFYCGQNLWDTIWPFITESQHLQLLTPSRHMI